MPWTVYTSTSSNNYNDNKDKDGNAKHDDKHDDDKEGEDGRNKIVSHNVVLFMDLILNPIDHHCISSIASEHPDITIITCNSNMVCITDDTSGKYYIWPSKKKKQVRLKG